MKRGLSERIIVVYDKDREYSVRDYDIGEEIEIRQEGEKVGYLRRYKVETNGKGNSKRWKLVKEERLYNFNSADLLEKIIESAREKLIEEAKKGAGQEAGTKEKVRKTA